MHRLLIQWDVRHMARVAFRPRMMEITPTEVWFTTSLSLFGAGDVRGGIDIGTGTTMEMVSSVVFMVTQFSNVM